MGLSRGFLVKINVFDLFACSGLSGGVSVTIDRENGTFSQVVPGEFASEWFPFWFSCLCTRKK
jgi:hypothetical protein